MKDPGDYIPGGIYEVLGDWYDDLLKCISEAQKDAYNEAIKDCITKIDSYVKPEDSRHAILKLKIK